MSGFWGADTEALRSIGSVYVRKAELLSDIETMLTSTIDNVEWIGPDAEAFRHDWDGRVRPGLQDCSIELRQEARRLIEHADEQDSAAGPSDVFRNIARAAPLLLHDVGRGGGEFAELLGDMFGRTLEIGIAPRLGHLIGESPLLEISLPGQVAGAVVGSASGFEGRLETGGGDGGAIGAGIGHSRIDVHRS